LDTKGLVLNVKWSDGSTTTVNSGFSCNPTSFSSPLHAADLNGDGKVDATDKQLLENYLAGIITKFPVQN